MASIDQRPENFSKNAKGKIFISQQTYEGFKITVNSIIETVPFLLQHGVSYVLTECFCQDPSLGDFGFNDNAIRNQKVFRPIAGNVRGGKDQSSIVEFSCEPIPCREKS